MRGLPGFLPVGCASCGPRIWLGGATGEWLPAVVAALREGKIVALKGVGGYQLLCDATNPDAVRRLRERKQRPLKPLAVLVASLEQADKVARIDSDSGRALADSANPIVLLRPSSKSAGGVPRFMMMAPSPPRPVLGS